MVLLATGVPEIGTARLFCPVLYKHIKYKRAPLRLPKKADLNTTSDPSKWVNLGQKIWKNFGLILLI
ncbi:hypothetical protein FRB95_012661 [Tulasnella sp. JGI-2019a]|nr:hypothetical protein FRB95_012661 [Tulasnella sp. JGI-2019a]